jgi:hypothetical protein
VFPSWIDLLLVLVGTGLAAAFRQPGLAAPFVVLGLVFPAVRSVGVGSRRVDAVAHHAPEEVRAAHRRVVLVAEVVGDRRAIEAAEDVLLEAAALFAGRTPRRGVQRRYVRQQVEALAALASDLEAVVEARSELDALDPDAALLPERCRDVLATVLLWVLGPFFVAWEVGAAAVRLTIAFVDGVLLRLRIVLALGWRLLRGVDDAWRRFRASWAEARARFVGARLRIRLRLRRALRAAR